MKLQEATDEQLVKEMLLRLGDDPNREGLIETPARVVKAWKEWFSGYGKDPKDVIKLFSDGAEGCDQLVLVKKIPVFSHCEHHCAPIFGMAHVGYIPHDKIIGLSKINRLVDMFARRLQVQERLTNQIADALEEHLAPIGVGVVLECRHFCIESRGVKQQGSATTTSALRGTIKDEHECRAEFMGLVIS